MKNNLKLLTLITPIFILLISVVVFVFNTMIAEGKPVITELSPNIVSGGETVEIRGKNFGEQKDSSNIIVSSIDLLSKYILFWSDDLIKIELPEKAGSGLVTVETGRGISKPSVLVAEKNVPYIGTGAYLPGLPFIETVNPPTGRTGTILTVKGDNFGVNKNNSRLLFSTAFSRETETIEGDLLLENFLEVSDSSLIKWENKEIIFYLPEMVSTGDVYIETESGFSNAVYFEQALVISGISLQNKKTYMINQSVSLSVPTIRDNNKVNIWITSPVEVMYQRNLINLPDPLIESICPSCENTLYRLESSEENNDFQISHNTIVDVYEQNCTVISSELNVDYDKNSPLYIQYISSSDLIPLGGTRIATVAKSITRRKNSSIEKAKAIYDYINARLTYSEDLEVTIPELVIDTQIGDSQSYALLFTALARSSGIPARPIAGIIVDSNRNVKTHWWAEFFIQGFGWFPLDPALADGLEWDNAVDNPVEYYWGNIDNQHIVFSRGEKVLPELFPGGTVYSDIDYVHVTHNIETDSEITQLRSEWSDVKITSIY